ncbi:hypothetical protein GCM10027089_04530 [Nocardia thraciensis]
MRRMLGCRGCVRCRRTENSKEIEGLWAPRAGILLRPGRIPFEWQCDSAHGRLNSLGTQLKRVHMWSIAVISVISAALIGAAFVVSFPDR